MAGVKYSVNFVDVETAVGSWKTVLALKAPANQMVKVCRVAIHAEGIAGDAKPFGVRLCRITAASGTGSAATPQKLNNALTATVQSTARVGFSSEPTEDGSGPYLYPTKFHPQGGKVDELTFDDLWLKEATEIALQVQTPTGGDVTKVSGHIVAEE